MIFQMVISRLFIKRLPAQVITVICIFLGYCPLAAFIAGPIFAVQGLLLYRFSIFLYSTVTYLCIGYSYFHIFNMSETARRIRILYEIYKNGKISRERLRSIYGPDEMLRIRLARLQETGQVRLVNGCYLIGNPLLYNAARIIALWRKVLGFE